MGIHTGTSSVGEFGTACRDFTIVGPVVNTASRLQSAAGLGEVLLTQDAYEKLDDIAPSEESRTLTLKGIDHPVRAFVLRPDGVANPT